MVEEKLNFQREVSIPALAWQVVTKVSELTYTHSQVKGIHFVYFQTEKKTYLHDLPRQVIREFALFLFSVIQNNFFGSKCTGSLTQNRDY